MFLTGHLAESTRPQWIEADFLFENDPIILNWCVSPINLKKPENSFIYVPMNWVNTGDNWTFRKTLQRNFAQIQNLTLDYCMKMHLKMSSKLWPFHTSLKELTHWQLLYWYQGQISWAFLMKLPSCECHKTSRMIRQHWLRWWLDAIRHQAITWSIVWPTSTGSHMALLG